MAKDSLPDSPRVCTSLGDLLRGAGVAQPAPGAPSAGERAGAPTETEAPRPTPGPLSGKVALQVSRKGRGGKTVTVVRNLRLGPEALEALAKDLRKALGVGTTVDGDDVVIQGDQAARVRPLLLARGARAVAGP